MTGRGIYHLRLTAPAEKADATVILPLALERADGIERVAFCCHVEGVSAFATTDVLLERIAPIIQRDFETIREAALKSIRSERKLAEISINAL